MVKSVFWEELGFIQNIFLCGLCALCGSIIFFTLDYNGLTIILAYGKFGAARKRV